MFTSNNRHRFFGSLFLYLIVFPIGEQRDGCMITAVFEPKKRFRFMTQRGAIRLKLLLVFLVFNLGFAIRPASAQQQKPVFWTRGGDWGNWLKITAHPGLSIRTACGDDSTLKNYPVSSTDWQLRNGYVEPMAVVWRVQFFDDSVGKNKMSGWMLERLKAGEVLDGWNVEGGHCQARNFISVQVKCAVREADVAKCYDVDGNPYPPRPDGAFSGDHNPNGSESGSHVGQAGPKLISAYWVCFAAFRANAYIYWEGVTTNVFQKGVETETLSGYGNKRIPVQSTVGTAYSDQFGEWVKSTYKKDLSGDGAGYQCYVFTTQQDAQGFLNELTTPPRGYKPGTYRVDPVEWSPK